MTDQANRPSPNLHSVEGDLFSAIFEFHNKVMALLREANLEDEKLDIATERLRILMARSTEEIKRTHDLSVQRRMDSMYEDVQEMLWELAELDSIRDQMERIYGETPSTNIPWNIESPPAAFVDLIETGQQDAAWAKNTETLTPDRTNIGHEAV